MTYRVIVALEAERDLDSIFRFVAVDDPAAAAKLARELRKHLKTLASMPRRCPRAPEDGMDSMEIRHLIHPPYRIVFALDGGTVVVLQVRHGARLPKSPG